MREKHFMLDIEATDTDFKHDDILEIAILEAKFRDGFWHPGHQYHRYLHTDKEPETLFAKENMSALFAKCHDIPYASSEEVREDLLHYFKDCGARPPYVYLMGWNVSTFDIPFLFEQIYLEPFYRQTIGGIETVSGDIHYRTYEQSGSISVAQCVFEEEERNELIGVAFDAYPELAMPAGKEHEALYDCYKQMRIENGLIRLLREGPSNFRVRKFNQATGRGCS
jgi:hypothetical protein